MLSLPRPMDNGALIEPQTISVSTPLPQLPQDAKETVSLGHTWRLLVRHWPWILLATVLGTAAMGAVSYIVRPVYQASARVTIAEEFPTQALGESAQPADSDVEQLINTEMQLIQSEAVLGQVADRFSLLRNDAAKSDGSGPFVLPGLSVARVPSSRLIDISYRSGDPALSAAVANAVANSYIQYNQESRLASSMELSSFLERQMSQLKSDMEASYKALAEYQQQLGVIDPAQKTTILTSRLLQLNTQLTDAQNERIREEAEYQTIQSGSTGAIEASPQATALTAIDDRVRAAQQKMEQMKSIYGPTYPEYKRAASDLAELTRQQADLRADITHRVGASYAEAIKHESDLNASLDQAKQESDRLNSTTFQYDQLQREADANANLYNELNKKIREEGISAGFQSSAVRLAVSATPPARPIFPRRNRLMFLGCVCSLAGSIVVLFVRDLMDERIHTPEAAILAAGAPVLGHLPEVPRFAKIHLAGQGTKKLRRNSEQVQRWEYYQECIASILSTVRFNIPSVPSSYSVLVTSPGAGEGKSSFALYLAATHAARGRKTLLIDADLRHPSIHRYLNLDGQSGLGQIIEGAATLKEVCQSVPGIAGLDVLTAGTCTQPPSATVGPILPRVLEQAVADYTLVVIDAPPLLGFAEPIEMARQANSVLLVACAGKTKREALRRAVTSLRAANAPLMGVLVNCVSSDFGDEYKHYRDYRRATVNTLT